MADRVNDGHQIERNFNSTDDLYQPNPSPDVIAHPLTSNSILNKLAVTRKDCIAAIHTQESMLLRQPEENLKEEEKRAACEEYMDHLGLRGYPLDKWNLQQTRAPLMEPNNSARNVLAGSLKR